MSRQTQHYKGTGKRTALALIALHVATPLAQARPTTNGAPHAQLQDAPEQELVALLERVAAARGAGETRAQAAVAVAKLLERGHSDAVTDRALETLGALGAPQAAATLTLFTQHRRPAARARAFAALGSVAGRDAKLREVVANGLRDSSPEVRGAAARALEHLHASEATPVLLRALGRGVAEAAVAWGTVGDAKSLETYSAYLNQQPLDVMLAGYDRYLARPDLPERTKLEVVARLEDVAGPAVLQFLSTIARNSKLPAAVRQAATTATLRIAKAVNAKPEGTVDP